MSARALLIGEKMIKQSEVRFVSIVDDRLEINFLVRCKDSAIAEALRLQILDEMEVVVIGEYGGSVASKKEMLEDNENDEQVAFFNTRATDDNTVTDITCFRYVGKHVFSVEIT